MDENDYEDAFIDPPFDPEDFVRAGGAEIAVPDDEDEYGAYGMFTVRGGVAVDQIVQVLREDAERQKQRRADLLESVRRMSSIVAKDHGEIGDTDVREQVYDAISGVYGGDENVPFTYGEFSDVWGY